ncbi:MAG: 23S rRNA (uracil(1939)-C(5))-methyltransferase RlmD, partial [Prevotella sp.]|nr:23S rRNA (uracil(1939)-C(5))-methyltransferase RlmD [Prevotella sp.]
GDDIRNFIYKYAQARGYTFYNIKENHGLLRTLMLRIVSTGEVMVCLSFGEKDYDNIRDILDAVSEKFPMITSLVYTINEKLNDTISDLEIRTWKGRDYLIEEMEGLRFRINAKSFYQTNSRQAYILYKIVRRLAGLDIALEKKPLVYDLYTGTGTIANFVARSASQVIGIEYVSEAIEDAKLNSRENGIDNTIFYAGDMKDVLTDEFVERHGRPEIMIVDPPRVGMHESVVKVILNTEPDVIVYVSCNPSTQARDLALLDEKYRVTDVQPVDMFPHTHHVENVVRLERR